MMRELRLCVTFDVDFADYTEGGSTVDEFEAAVPSILSCLGRHPSRKTTWFIRLDDQIGALYGRPDHIFRRYADALRQLQRGGHELGWHPHCYVRAGGRWRQNVDEAAVLDELGRCAPLARSYGLRAARMGWGFHTPRTMRLLADSGFAVDSSAIPRPKYAWEEAQRDWTTTPSEPYRPSAEDYRVPGPAALPILEVPISVTRVAAPYDTEEVLRYVNLAYHPPLLRAPLEGWLSGHEHLVTITHPYELIPARQPHGLLACDPGALEENLDAVQELARRRGLTVSFLTMSELAVVYEGGSYV